MKRQGIFISPWDKQTVFEKWIDWVTKFLGFTAWCFFILFIFIFIARLFISGLDY